MKIGRSANDKNFLLLDRVDAEQKREKQFWLAFRPFECVRATRGALFLLLPECIVELCDEEDEKNDKIYNRLSCFFNAKNVSL